MNEQPNDNVGDNTDSSPEAKKPFQWRWNVLILVGGGYVAVLLIFLFLTWQCNAETAFDAIQAALMALVGGSLAIAKDLID